MLKIPGQQLGNYRLMRLLGRGGFADVYLGEHIYLTTQAAIKVLQLQLGSDERDNFLNEARTIAHLVHPNIIRILDLVFRITLLSSLWIMLLMAHYASVTHPVHASL